MSDQRLVELIRVSQSFEAHTLRGLLEEKEIPCFIFDEQIHNVTWHLQQAYGGIRLMVRKSDLQEALEVLSKNAEEQQDNYDDDDDSDSGPAPLLPRTNRGIFNSIISIIILIISGIPTPIKDRKK